jgi:hypothetical protein
VKTLLVENSISIPCRFTQKSITDLYVHSGSENSNLMSITLVGSKSRS